MFNYYREVKKLDSKGIVDAKILFTISTLANFAKKDIEMDGVVTIGDKTTDKYQTVVSELDKIIDLSLTLMNGLDDDDRASCSINDINRHIINNCEELSPELLAFYIAMNAFTEAKKEVLFDERLNDMRNIKVNECSGHIIDILDRDGGCNLDAAMWSMATSIINIIKGNDDEEQ